MAASARNLLAVASLLGAALALAAIGSRLREGPRAPAPARAGGPPDLLLVTVDTLRADHVGVYGGPDGITPHLDRLAREGAYFADAEAPAPSTLASHASLFTARYPHRHGVHRNGWVLPAAAVTLAERLAAAGYETAAFVSSFAVVAETGIGQGFATFDDRGLERRGGYHIEQVAERTNERVKAWWEGRDEPDAPFFAWVHYFDPHYPYQPPRPYARRFAGRYEGAVDGSMRDVKRVRERFLRTGVEDEDGRQLRRLYAGEVAYVDACLGDLLDWLAARGALDRAVVVVTADHGETFAEHRFGAYDHGQNVYLTNTRVPLIAWGPAWLPRRGRIGGPVSLVDVAPTLLELLGAAPLPDPDGRSLLPALRDGRPLERDRFLFAEATRGGPSSPSGMWPNAGLARAVRQGPMRLVRAPLGRGRNELYDVSRDPLEARDLSGDPRHAEVRAALAAALERFDRSQADFVPSMPMGDLETLERLKALGYVDDADAAREALEREGAAGGTKPEAGGR